MRLKAIGFCFLLLMFIFSACTNVEGPQTKEETTTSKETSQPNAVEVQDFTSDCSKVVVPSNVERDTNLDKEKELLTVSWYDNSKGKDVGVVFRYSEQNCSESAKQLIQHVLGIEKLPTSEGKELQLKNIDTDILNNGSRSKLELYARVDQYGNPLTWHLKVDGAEKIMLSLVEPGIYGVQADIKVEDIDGDGYPEVLIYRYSLGSSGAAGLNVYSPSKEWNKIFSIENPFEFDNDHAKDRYEVKYLGDWQANFIDHQTGLKATIPLDKMYYENREPKFTTWIDPISEYGFQDENKDGFKEIIAVQRIIGSSHPETIGLLKTTYTFFNDEYQPSNQSVYDVKGQLISQVNLGLKSTNSEASSSCKTAPKTLNWNGKEYVLITENTSEEPVMKLGFLKCSNGKFINAGDDDNNSYTVRGAGNPTKTKDLIIIGKWGRALYSPVKEEVTKEETVNQ